MTTPAPTPEAIEAVAKVIYESNPIPAGFLGGSEEPVPWERLGSGWKAPHRLTATAALAAAAPFIAAQAKAEALREAAEVYGAGEWVDGFMSVRDDVSAVQAIVAWLNDRAATIESEPTNV